MNDEALFVVTVPSSGDSVAVHRYFCHQLIEITSSKAADSRYGLSAAFFFNSIVDLGRVPRDFVKIASSDGNIFTFYFFAKELELFKMTLQERLNDAKELLGAGGEARIYVWHHRVSSLPLT